MGIEIERRFLIDGREEKPWEGAIENNFSVLSRKRQAHRWQYLLE